MENLCQGLAELALDGESGGQVTVVNAGAIRPGDTGLDGKADHERTQKRMEEIFKSELARIQGRVVKQNGC